MGRRRKEVGMVVKKELRWGSECEVCLSKKKKGAFKTIACMNTIGP